MSSPRKSFALGCLTGALIAPLLFIALGLGSVFLFRDFFADYAARQQAARLAPPALDTGLQADYTLAFSDPHGVGYTLEAYRGRTIFAYFWHPQCVACVAGLPALKHLFDATADLDVLPLLVALEDDPDIEALRQTHGIHNTVHILDGPRPPVFDSKGVTPAAYLIAADGTIAFRHAGAAKWDDEALIALVRAVAATGAAS